MFVVGRQHKAMLEIELKQVAVQYKWKYRKEKIKFTTLSVDSNPALIL